MKALNIFGLKFKTQHPKLKTYLAFLVFHFLLFTIFSTSCKKAIQPDPYPSVTSEGKNIWACKINGKPIVYTILKDLNHKNDVTVSVYGNATDINSIILHCSRNNSVTEKDNQTITIEEDNPILGKKYYFNKDNCFFTYVDDNANTGTSGFASFYNSGWVIFHRIDNIVSGEFELIGDNHKGDTAFISEGRFDITK